MIAESESNLGTIKVFTTANRGFTPEEIADRTLEKIIYVGEKSHPLIVEQAKAFKESIREVLVNSLQEAQSAAKTDICAKLSQNGYQDLSQIIRGL